MQTQRKRDYLMLKIRGQLIKLDPDIFYKIINPQHELPYKKYNGDITSVRLSITGYPVILFEDKTRKAKPGQKKPVKCIMLARYIMNAKEGDIGVHVCRTRQLTNFRAKNEGLGEQMEVPVEMTLEDALNYISDDELVEVTPKNIRIRKKFLSENERKRIRRDEKNG